MEAIWYVVIFGVSALWLYWLRKFGVVRFVLWLLSVIVLSSGMYSEVWLGVGIPPAQLIHMLVLTLAPPVCWFVERQRRDEVSEWEDD